MAVRKMHDLRSEPHNTEKYKFSKKGLKLNLKVRTTYRRLQKLESMAIYISHLIF